MELAPIANQGLMNLSLHFFTYLTRQMHIKLLSQNHNSLIFMTNPLQTCSKTDKVVTAIRIDSIKETADIDERNNNWPVREVPSGFQVFRQNKQKEQLNPMQKAKKKVIKP